MSQPNAEQQEQEKQGALSPSQRTAVTEEKRFDNTDDRQIAWRLLSLVGPYRGLFFLSLLSYPLISAFQLVQPYLLKVAVDEHLVPRKLDGFSWIIIAMLTALAFELLVRLAQAIITQILGQKITRDLRRSLFEKLQRVDLAYIERNPVGRLMTRVTNDVEALQETFSSGAVSIVGDIVTLVGVICIMLWLDAWLTLYAFSLLPILAIFINFMRLRARSAFRELRSVLSNLNAFLAESLSGIYLIQIFLREKSMSQEFDKINTAYRDANYRAIRYDATTYAVVEALSTIATACLLVLGIVMFRSESMQVGTFVAFIDYLRRFFFPINELSTKYTMLQSAFASAERCFDLLDQQPSVVDKELAKEADKPQTNKDNINPELSPDSTHGIVFDKINFSYFGTTEPFVLKDLTLNIQKREKVAIVGATGSGKSTLVKLLCRFYDPSFGRILWHGQDLKDIPLKELRSRVAVVLQDPYLFDGTIRDNIAYAIENPTDKILETAAKRTLAWEVIQQAPDGWNTIVGDRGSNLSTGQRQLIAFARALAKSPELLILDEATSSVDPETETQIQKGLEALLVDRTALIVAHRLSTIERADRIVVLSHGQIAEEGTHTALLQKDGIYRQLYELQFADQSH